MNARPKLLLRLVAGLSPAGMPHPLMQTSGEEEHTPGPFEDVSDNDLAMLLSAARVAPSADNAQIWRFVTVRDPRVRRSLGAATGGALSRVFAEAPVVIVACGVRFLISRMKREQPFALLDVPISLLHILLQAQEMGLLCSWTITPNEKEVRSLLGIPDETRVVAMLAVAGPPV